VSLLRCSSILRSQYLSGLASQKQLELEGSRHATELQRSREVMLVDGVTLRSRQQDYEKQVCVRLLPHCRAAVFGCPESPSAFYWRGQFQKMRDTEMDLRAEIEVLRGELRQQRSQHMDVEVGRSSHASAFVAVLMLNRCCRNVRPPGSGR
jgi:hypothetical protein